MHPQILLASLGCSSLRTGQCIESFPAFGMAGEAITRQQRFLPGNVPPKFRDAPFDLPFVPRENILAVARHERQVEVPKQGKNCCRRIFVKWPRNSRSEYAKLR